MNNKEDHHLFGGIDAQWGAASLPHWVNYMHVFGRKKRTEYQRWSKGQKQTVCMHKPACFLLLTFCHLQCLSAKKKESTQSGQRAAGNSTASARQQRPTVFAAFGLQTKSVCARSTQVTEAPRTDVTFVFLWVSVLIYLLFSATSFFQVFLQGSQIPHSCVD